MTKLIVEKQKIIDNLNSVRAVTKAEVMAVVKGNGYGLGLCELAALLYENGVRHFGVATLMEGVELRKSGILCEILLLTPLSDRGEIETLLDHNITPTVGSTIQGKMLNEVANAKKIKTCAHIKVETGFSRYGFAKSEISQILSLKNECQSVEFCGIFSHLSASFGEEKHTKAQFNEFVTILKSLEDMGVTFPLVHLANSCATLKFESTHFNMVRVGSALLGRLPIPNNLQKVGYLENRINEIKWIEKGENVGYANVYKTRARTRIAIVQTGYMDGFTLVKDKDTYRPIDVLRYLYANIKKMVDKSPVYAFVGNKKARVIGRVSMCNIVLDVTKIECEIGDKVKMDVNPLLVSAKVVRDYV